MNKKHAGNPADDYYDDITSGQDFGDNVDSMAQYASYKQFEVDTKSETLRKDCKNMILSLCKIYLDSAQITNEDYVKAVAISEEQNLFVMMKQVQYADHVLDSLMRQLDSGGYVDKGIYDTIRNMQKSAIQITLEISKYTRNLPEYFKFIARDIKNVETSTDILLNSAKSQAVIDVTSSTTTIDDFNPSLPQRGMRELMLKISDVRQDIDNAIKNSTEVEATPMSIDDLDVYDDNLEDDLDEDE